MAFSVNAASGSSASIIATPVNPSRAVLLKKLLGPGASWMTWCAMRSTSP